MLHLLAAEAATETFAQAPGMFAAHAYLIPLLLVAAFVGTLFVGKRLPMRGPEIGLACVGIALLLSTCLGVEWLGRDKVALVDRSPAAIEATYRGTAAGDTEHALPRAEAEPAPAAGEKVEEAVDVRPYYEKELTWFQSGATKIGVGWHIDGLSIIMLFTVTFISLMVHIFSLEYLGDDRRKTHYFAALDLFTAGMLIMVIAPTSLQLLLGWEIMGLCSFMLIGHWWEEQKNSNAAMKAFFTTRTGDIGLLVGLSILFFAAGQTFNIARTNQLAAAGQLNHTWILFGAISLFVACVGKSAQFPLHTWLPDAMAGPTPASALIHAATMVVAGVYMVARLYPVFFHAFRITTTGINPIAVIGGITIIIAAGLAFVQTDIKKVLAYSTVSQLGYMVMALGVGAWTGGLFHLFTHAFFKALLFLGAGSLSHGTSHTFEMEDFGGLRKHMKITHATFVVGTLGLIGCPLIAGWWSKDEILLGASRNGYQFFAVVGSVGAAMTAAYMTRVYFKTFMGDYHGPRSEEALAHAAHGAHGDDHVTAHDVVHGAADEHAPALSGAPAMHKSEKDTALVFEGDSAEHGPFDDEPSAAHGGTDAHGEHDWHDPHESPPAITVPLITLAVASVVAGFLNAPGFEGFTHFSTLEGIVASGVPEHAFSLPFAIVTSIPAAIGVGLAYLYWFTESSALGLRGLTKHRFFAWFHHFLVKKYYLDVAYEQGLIYFIKKPLAAATYWFNQNVLDGVVNGVATQARSAAAFTYGTLDQQVVDGTVNGVGAGANGLGKALRFVASGKVSQYAAILFGAAGAGAIILALLS